MTQQQKDTLEGVAAVAARYWQIGAALLAIGMSWATLTARVDALALSANERRAEIERRMVEADTRHEQRLTSVEVRANAAERELAAIAAELRAVRSGVEELVRDARARR